MAKGGDGLLIAALIGIPVVAIAADYTVLEGRLGIARAIDKLIGRKLTFSETTPGALTPTSRAGTPESRGQSTGGGVGGPGYEANYVRISLS